MNYTIRLYHTFRKQFKRLFKKYRSLETDTDALVESLLENGERQEMGEMDAQL